jgi:hypothetical protein
MGVGFEGWLKTDSMELSPEKFQTVLQQIKSSSHRKTDSWDYPKLPFSLRPGLLHVHETWPSCRESSSRDIRRTSNLSIAIMLPRTQKWPLCPSFGNRKATLRQRLPSATRHCVPPLTSVSHNPAFNNCHSKKSGVCCCINNSLNELGLAKSHDWGRGG